MRRVSRSALVPYTADEMYALVADVGTYPEFLPWCSSTTVHAQDDDTVEASIELERGGISKEFRTRNDLVKGRSMDIKLVDGPFRQLDGGWRFEQLGEDGCKVRFDMTFEFENRLVDAVFGRYFEDTCNALIESFIRRAREIYD